MIVRVATLDDVEAISTMYRDFFTFHAHMQPDYYKAAEAGEYPANSIRSEDNDIIVVEVDGNIAGFAHVFENRTSPYDSVVSHRFAHLMDLYVSPLHRETGLGRALIKATKDWAKKRNLDYIELTLLAENENAARLYAQENFKTVMHTMRCTLELEEIVGIDGHEKERKA